jgi:cytochrome P450
VPYFDPARPSYLENPYPALARLRREAPVAWIPTLQAWVVTAWDPLAEVLHDHASFSADPASAGGEFGARVRASRARIPLGGAPIMGNSDPPLHDLLRRRVNRWFTPAAVARLRADVERVASALLGDLPSDAPVDIMGSFAERLPVQVILHLLGVPASQQAAFRTACLAIMRARNEGAGNPEVVADAANAVERLDRVLREAPPDSLIGRLRGEAVPEELPPEHLLMLVVHLATAGNGPLALFIGNAVLALAANPEAAEALRQGSVSWVAALEELARFDTPTHVISRWAKAPVALAGRSVRPGDTVHLVLGAANRDPARFSEPDRLDFGRRPGRHAAFGLGVHFCLGANLARLEAEVALRLLLERFPDLRVLSVERLPSFQLRGPRRLVLAPPSSFVPVRP